MIAKVTSAVKYKGKVYLTGQEIEFDEKDKEMLLDNINKDSIKKTNKDGKEKPEEETEYTEEDLKEMELEEIKKLADELKINYPANIGKDTLIAKIIDFAGE